MHLKASVKERKMNNCLCYHCHGPHGTQDMIKMLELDQWGFLVCLHSSAVVFKWLTFMTHRYWGENRKLKRQF